MKHSVRGVTIIETLAVLAILAVLTATAASYFRLSAKVRIAATKQTMALMEAQNALEIWTQMESERRQELTGAKPVGEVQNEFLLTASQSKLGREQTTRIRLRPVTIRGASLEEITVEVQWKENQSPRSVKLVGWTLVDSNNQSASEDSSAKDSSKRLTPSEVDNGES